MAKLDSFVCDECSTQRKDVNHWWATFKNGAGGLSVMQWDRVELEKLELCGHYCGQSCVHSALDRWMTTGSLDKK